MDEHGLAQRFTTGGKSAGYVLQEVSLRIPSTYESRFMSFSARLYAVTAGGAIGNQTAGFSHGATPSGQDWDLTATGHIVLQPNSQYIVQVLCDSGCANDNYIAFAATTSNGEDSDVNSDPSGVAWTLANNFQRRSDDWENNGTRSLVMAVKGRYAVPPLRPDLTVSSIADTAGALLLEWEIRGVTGNAARTPTQGMEYRTKLSSEGAFGSWRSIPSSKPGEANDESYRLTSLTNGLSHDVQVRALNQDGPSGASATASAVVGEQLGVCSRTRAVQTALATAAGVNDCAGVTSARLSGIQSLSIQNAGTVLKSGDFDGLTSLTLLYLSNIALTALPGGVFDDLTSLQTLYLSNNDLAGLPGGVFDDLTSLEVLYLNGNQLTGLSNRLFAQVPLKSLWLNNNLLDELHPDVFATLTSLQTLLLSHNQLSDLPAGLFEDLSQLSTLQAEGNTVDPLPLSVDLERVGQSGFRAVAPVGAPFDIVLPVSVTNGSIAGGAATITIPAGDVESSVLTVTRSVGASAATTVDIGTAPALPANHSGYGLSKATGLPLTMPGLTVTPTTLTVDEGGGGTYAVVLDTRPSGTVTVTVGGTTGTDVSVGDTTLAFTTGNWSTAQTVTVSAAEDSDTANDTVSLTHSAASTDSDYDGIAIAGVVVTVEDDDVTALAKPTNLTATAGDGQVALAWDTPAATADITHHEYRYKWSGEAAYPETWTEIADSAPGDANEDEVTVGSLENGLPYDFQIRAVNAMGASEPSDAASALAGDGLGICNRTLTVQTVILREIAGVSDCADVTAAHLSAITGRIDFVGSIGNFKVGDLDGLSSLEELIVQSNSRLTELPAGIFDDLSSLTTLQIGANAISTLRSDVFSNLSSLTTLGVTYNQLTALPAGVFDGLSSLATLKLENNPVDPLPLSVNLERVGQSGFRAVAPVGAPFDIVLPVSVTNGSIAGGAATITIPAGDVESSVLTVTRSVGASAATTVDIGTVPALPANHSGYGLSKATGLPLTMPGLTVTPTTLTVDEGGGGTYTVVLDTRPSATVTVTVGGTTGTDVSVGDTTLAFTTGNWSTAQTVTVSAAEDSDTANDTVSLTHSAASTDSDYNGIAIAGVVVTVEDDDVTALAKPTNLTATAGDGQVALAWDTPAATADITHHEYRYKWSGEAAYPETWTEIADSAPGDANEDEVTVGSLENGLPYDFQIRAVNAMGASESSDAASALAGDGLGICNRTLTVQTVILREIAGVSDCADVTAAHLSAITGRIDFVGSIGNFKVGDLDGLSSLEELIVQSNSRLTELPAGIFDDLSSLTTLHIGGNAISTLRSDVFSNLSSLTTLGVAFNGLTALPAGLFAGLSALSSLQMEGNTVDPLPLSVNLERAGQSGFRAVAPVGAPFDIVLPVSVTNGSIAGGAATITIPTGDVESSVLTVTRSVGASAATTVDIGTAPALPANHSGYGLSKAAGLPLTMPGLTVTPTTLTVDEGGGGTYTVVLDTRPSATVTVTVGGTTGTDVSVGDTTLAFTTGNWSTAQTVTVSAAEDSDTANDTVSLTHSAASTDSDYNGIAIAGVVVTVEDDDVTALAKPTNLTATAGDGQVALAWDTPAATADITHHEYRYKWSGEAAYPETWTEIASSAPGDANEDEVTVGSLENGLPYDFQIRAVNAMGASEPSDAASALAGDGLGICNRTLTVQTVILREIAGVSDCADVTAAHLSAITGRIDFVGSIGNFKVGDLDGLSSLEELIVQSNSRLTELPAGIFDDLSSLTTLHIGGNAISTLRSDVFSNLSSLTTLGVAFNGLTALPAGLFAGLSALSSLQMEGNTVDPLPLSVNLERAGQSGFRAVAPVGAPFDIVLPVSVTNGSIAGGAATITIPAGDVESSVLTVTRSVGASAATTVDIGTVPALPANHSGYGLSKATGLPLTMPGLTVTPTTLTVDEGGGGTYTVVLDTRPSATVTVTVGGTTGTDVSVGDTTLAFTTGNWSTAQTVTVSAAEETPTRRTTRSR